MSDRKLKHMDIRELLIHIRAQSSDRQVARDTGFNRRTVKRYRVWAEAHGLLVGEMPGWTFEATGLDVRKFHDTGAAIVHATHGDPFPCMIWFTNNNKLAAMTMFTLFFGGDDFAPKTRVQGEPVQEYLQRHYIQAIQQLALHLKGLPNVIGYDTMNEPDRGMIGRAFSSKGLYPRSVLTPMRSPANPYTCRSI